MAAETITIDVVINSINQTSSGMNSARQSADRFTESVRRARQEADRLGGTHARPRVSVVDRATSTLTKINNGLKSIGSKTKQAIVKVKDYATAPLRKISNALFSIKGLVMAIGSAWAANKLFMEPLNLADSYSSAKIGFSTLLGDTKGQSMMDDLDEFAKATPFKTSGVIENAQKMMAMGWDAENIITDMRTIGDAAAATGKMDQGLESIVRALAQIKTKGKLSTEELNQLSEAGIAAKAMLAEQMGYGTGDSGIAKMTKDLEKGLIGSEQAIQALLEGMKQYEGTMERTANETVEGLKSQLMDTFEINILRKWGQGLQDGAKRGLGSILKLLDESEEGLEKLGDTLYEIGKDLSNWGADKLENLIDKVIKVTNSDAFKDADMFGKIKIMWNEIIAEPFSKWWNSTGQAFFEEKVTAFAKKMGEGIVKYGGAALKAGFSALFNTGPIGKVIAGAIALKIFSGGITGMNMLQSFWSGTGATSAEGTLTMAGMGLKGILGTASTATGTLTGSGVIGALAKLGMKSTAGLSVAPYTGGGLALAGLGTAAGIAGGVAGTINAVNDLTKTIKADTRNDQKLYGARAGVKGGMVAAGALVGTMIAPGIGTAIGAGIGGIATFVAGNKLADAISGVSKSTKELNAEAEKLARQDMAKRFGEMELSADQLAERIQQIFGADTISRVNSFNTAMDELAAIENSLYSHKDTISLTSERIKAGETLSESDVAAYQEAVQGYATATADLLSANKKTSTSAFQLLYGDDTKGLQKATENINSTYTKLEKQLAERTSKLNEVISDAFSDGKITIDEEKKIDEVVKQIEEIEKKIQERLEKKRQAESAASYDLLGKNYKDTDLTSESFKQLLSELDAQGEADMKAYDDAYIKAKAELDIELEEGTIKDDEYKKTLEEIEKKWRNGKAITVKQKVNVALDVLKTNYSAEFEGIENALNGTILGKTDLKSVKNSTTDWQRTNANRNGGNFETAYKWDKNSEIQFKELQDSFLNGAGVDDSVRKQMSELYDSLKPQEKDLQELKKSYEEAGEKVPKWIEDSLSDIENIKLMSGDIDSFYRLIGEQIAGEDKEYAEKLLEKAGEDLPDALREGIEKGLGKGVDVEADVNVEAGKLDTVPVSKATQKAIKALEEDGAIQITKEGEVTIDSSIKNIDDVDAKTKRQLQQLENAGIIEIDREGNITVKANVDTSAAKTKSEQETKDALGKNQTVNKTAIVPVDSVTTGEGAAADKSKAEVKSALDQRFGTSISENGKVKINSVSISGAGTAIANAWSTFKSWVKEKFSVGVSVTSNVRVNQRMGTTDNSSGGKKANGGYVDKAIHALVGEAGPEMIIPLSPERRQRGKALWERAGRAMGLWDDAIPNANGGLYGIGSSKLGDMMSGISSVGSTESPQRTSGTSSVQVDVGGVNITIQGSGNGVQQDIQDNADAICGQIAEILQKAFQNMPTTVTG